MKKILLSTTLLALTAGAAAAEVTLSGSGRFGLDYSEDRLAKNDAADGIVGNDKKEMQISYRLRINVDAKFEADNGVTYGGRIRFQDGGGKAEASFSPAMLYVEASGVRVEVGNANTAYDSVALMYAPEVGFQGRSFGDPRNGDHYSFSSGSYGADRVGIYAAYSVSGVNLKASYIQGDQASVGIDNESSIAADYTFGQVTLAAAYADNAGGTDQDLTFVGAAYKFSDAGSVGLNYNGNGIALGKTTTIYGTYAINGIGLIGYVTDSDVDGEDTAYGLGASYDLGGATLAGGIESGFDGNLRADLGVNMSF